MNNNYDDYLGKILSLFSLDHITDDTIKSLNSEKNFSECKFLELPPHSELLCANTLAKTIFIALKGNFQCVIPSSTTGEKIVVDILQSPYIFGLLEYILHLPKYTASIQTLSSATVLAVPSEIFLHALHHNLTVANICLSYFAGVAHHYMDMSEISSLYNCEDTILMYLFSNCSFTTFPFTLKISRKALSDLLHINIRTLYRYLSKLEKNGYFSILNGKITINTNQYKKIENYCINFLGNRPRPYQIYNHFIL